MDKRKLWNLQLNNIVETDDPTQLKCTFSIFDFEKSHNNTVIEEELALEIAETIMGKPIVTKYHEVEDFNTSTDALGGHEASLGTNKHGELDVQFDTTPIGTFMSNGYITTILDENGAEKKVLAADAILWKTRFSDACDLIVEWFNRGVNINTSCELLYKNYTFVEGVEYLQSPVYFEGHCVLNSEQRGDHAIVNPAYDSAKLLSLNEVNEFRQLVAQAINQDTTKEGEDMFKKVFELSHSDVRTLLYGQLDPTLGEGVYSWITDVYEGYFIVELDSSEGYHYYKYEYSKNDEAVSINFDSKTEVFLKRDWVEVTQFEQIQNELKELKETHEEAQTQLNEATKSVKDLEIAKSELEVQFNDASEKLIKLNSEIDTLSPFKEKYEQEQFEKKLSEKKEYYSAKFEAVNAEEEFAKEEIQSLIAEAAKDNNEAVLQLNTKLVDLVQVPVKEEKVENQVIRELSSKRENLIADEDDFDSLYSI
ncbi:hypothetical protein BEH_07260 [Priestia filamentosa]|uniref:Uncharacterized protein n=1 Tax=Priestia filamentosa TaxID=1402861 RepID=A0A0H4KCT1_9BACI|nr:hypothetical protein [Priestia filamentosa]AKO91917.1 hypothetical protein BEH_07260 [Priestia filamentosa]